MGDVTSAGPQPRPREAQALGGRRPREPPSASLSPEGWFLHRPPHVGQ